MPRRNQQNFTDSDDDSDDAFDDVDEQPAPARAVDYGLPTEVSEVKRNHDPQSHLLPTSLFSHEGKIVQIVLMVDRDYGAKMLHVHCGACGAIVKAISYASHCTKCRKEDNLPGRAQHLRRQTIRFPEKGQGGLGGEVEGLLVCCFQFLVFSNHYSLTYLTNFLKPREPKRVG